MMADKDVILKVTTRRQAIESGELVDMTNRAHKVGFTVPVAITDGVWRKVLKNPGKGAVVDAFLAYVIAQVRKSKSSQGPIVEFQYKDFKRLWLHAGPGDKGEMVMIIMFPEEY
jgi:hypothetical protein